MAVSSERGSPKANDASTEASTTLAGIALFPDYFRALVGSLYAKPEEFLTHLGNRRSLGTNRFLQDIQKLALKGAMMGCGAAAQLSNEPFGHSNRQVYRSHLQESGYTNAQVSE